LAARNGLGGGGATASVKHTFRSGMWVDASATIGLGAALVVRANHRIDRFTVAQISYKLEGDTGFGMSLLAQRQLTARVTGSVAWNFGADHGIMLGVARHTDKLALESELKARIHPFSSSDSIVGVVVWVFSLCVVFVSSPCCLPQYILHFCFVTDKRCFSCHFPC